MPDISGKAVDEAFAASGLADAIASGNPFAAMEAFMRLEGGLGVERRHLAGEDLAEIFGPDPVDVSFPGLEGKRAAANASPTPALASRSMEYLWPEDGPEPDFN
ncbi:hypothetical protein [Defluviimonas salinarum]|uniref:Uncharacterized protein n=1 Tax=Defluviimonas salinarum TaxID=2992147 RepID=A0ABT3J8W7_9RHOB|nr:hypothetical protein [Defluviimonas salinarum]MCW3783880.1 hypothetical protein [Defluviimonas salinarum]